MTEEEAVAGMEDVETIARRILEEEGLPYTPPDQVGGFKVIPACVLHQRFLSRIPIRNRGGLGRVVRSWSPRD